MLTKGLPGIWTPWAKVLCFNCHGNTFNSFNKTVLDDAEMAKMEQLVEVGEFSGVTPCDKCKRGIIVRTSIAVEHDMALDLVRNGIEASLSQTGGMCDALSISRTNGGEYLMVYDIDGDKDFIISAFDAEGDCNEGREALTYDYDEMMQYIQELPDIVRTTTGDGSLVTEHVYLCDRCVALFEDDTEYCEICEAKTRKEDRSELL